MKRRHVLAAALAAAVAALAHAQGAFPTKPIRLVVPFAHGRHVRDRGAGRRTAAVDAARAGGRRREQGRRRRDDRDERGRAGGARRLHGDPRPRRHAGRQSVRDGKQPYDVNRDFVPVALLARVPNLFVLNAQLPAKELQGIHRAREEGARQAQLRLRRQRQRRAPRVRVPEARHRHRRRARAVQAAPGRSCRTCSAAGSTRRPRACPR